MRVEPCTEQFDIELDLSSGSDASLMVRVFTQFLILSGLGVVEGLYDSLQSEGDAAIIDADGSSFSREVVKRFMDGSADNIILNAAETKYLIVGQDGEFDEIKQESFAQKSATLLSADHRMGSESGSPKKNEVREATLAQYGSEDMPAPIARTIDTAARIASRRLIALTGGGQ